MTYEQDYENRIANKANAGYPQSTGSSKWLLISLAIIVALIGSASFFSSQAPVGPADGTTEGLQLESSEGGAVTDEGTTSSITVPETDESQEEADPEVTPAPTDSTGTAQ